MMKSTVITEKKAVPKKDKDFMAMLRSKKKGASTAKDKKEDCKCKDKKEKCTCKDKKKAKKSVTENTVFSFKQFINESEDFQNKFDPSNFENEDDEHEISPMGSDDDDSDEQEHSDDELIDAHDGSGKDDFGGEDFDDDSDFEDTGDSGLGDTTSSKSGGSKVDKINNELMDVNNEIGRMLDQYTSDRDIETYKKNASPLLAKRKELQAKLDSAFNIGVGQDTGEDLEMQDDTYQF